MINTEKKVVCRRRKSWYRGRPLRRSDSGRAGNTQTKGDNDGKAVHLCERVMEVSRKLSREDADEVKIPSIPFAAARQVSFSFSSSSLLAVREPGFP
jgi:hypothetical protein